MRARGGQSVLLCVYVLYIYKKNSDAIKHRERPLPTFLTLPLHTHTHTHHTDSGSEKVQQKGMIGWKTQKNRRLFFSAQPPLKCTPSLRPRSGKNVRSEPLKRHFLGH